MPHLCRTCSHPERTRIDEVLLAGETLAAVGKRFDLTPSSLCRHKRNHLLGSGAKAGAAPLEVDLSRRVTDLEGQLTAVKQAVQILARALVSRRL